MHLMDMRFAKLQTCSKAICCDANDTGYGFHVMFSRQVCGMHVTERRVPLLESLRLFC